MNRPCLKCGVKGFEVEHYRRTKRTQRFESHMIDIVLAPLHDNFVQFRAQTVGAPCLYNILCCLQARIKLVVVLECSQDTLPKQEHRLQIYSQSGRFLLL